MSVKLSKGKTMSESMADVWKKAFREAEAERDSLKLQVAEAMKACPWATHARNHTEPKHCIAALAFLIEMRENEMRKDQVCDSCGWNNGPDHGGGSRSMHTIGKVTKCGSCFPTTR
jgi:hypothetical protein